MMIKRKCEEFVEGNIKGYEVAKHFYKEHLVAITISGGSKGKDVYIYDEYHMDVEDDDKRIVLGMNTMEELLNERPDDVKEMILYFLDKGALKDFFYYDFGEGKCVERIPDVKNLDEWEEKQLIPILENFELFGSGSDFADLRKCNHLIKGGKALDFLTDIIDMYGFVKFGDSLEIGKISMTEEEYEELKELW